MTITLLQPATIRKRRFELQHRIKELKSGVKARIQAVEAQLLELRMRCPHNTVHWYPDAAGGNSSVYVCNDCDRHSKSEFGQRGR